MTIFAVLLPADTPKIAEQIQTAFPNDHYMVSGTQWLVSSSLTAVELSAKLGVYDPKNPGLPTLGNAIIFATSSYFGRAPQTVWDWLKVKLESRAVG
jgi:hypothetical protein